MKNVLLIIILLFMSISFGIIKVGIALTEPYAYFEEVNDGYLLKGIDINLIKMLSKDLNEKVEIYIYNFSDLIENGLKEMDMIIGGIHITDERKKHIKFTIPYLTTGLVILELKDNEKSEIKSFAVKNDSTGYKTVLKWKKYGKDIIYTVYETNEECLNAVLSKKVDGAFFDLVNAIYLMKKHPVKIYKEPLTKNDVGIGVKTKDLLEKINPLILKYRRENLIGE
ncbi:polar amino acid transport system substrate-binding protein [Marinitoga hydrogenitolerans DSM 16785]|uniref:Polar amino acid transport system substrate-binding protein n=1 Tax=Marinitoga hydrogenitolerans (strain DSM 16785 / JCM 12826 / AT1271) TaxID=1122195 RepID=A0A1M4VP19_MARH1|nr:transporter substrate-binding domain-containing protein [Marinitoga hydrogenitolerans]SHE70590.1 polar amino acid transport system substrate-binding protein [Marinitoga hydrogenitolerans DSM 16785]